MTRPQAQTVLAIDDSADVLALITVRLKPEGVRILTAKSGEEGIALAIAEKPDLVLLDVEMPGQGGLDVCRKLKSDSATQAIPIIFLTGTDDVNTKVHGFDLGAVDYVMKPFHPDELRARVRAALRMKRAQDLLGREAQVDALTGLRTRGYLETRLAGEVEASKRDKTPVSLVLLEIDHLRPLMDAFGHPFGDMVLQRVAEVVSRVMRSTDAACTYSGDELVLVLPRTPREEAEAIAKAVHDGIRALELVPRGRRVVVTASLGVSEALEVERENGTVDADGLLAAAEAALSAAKREGRDCVRGGTGKTPDVPRVETTTGPRDDSDQRAGKVLLERYVLDRKIGEGGMGSVYRAMHLSLGEPVAVKFMNDVWKGSDEHRTRFRREAAILARLRHPGIVSILDFGELDSELFMVMELVKGSPLSDFVVVPGRLSPPRIGTIFRDLLEVLAVAHAENVVHRDIKPENVMLLDSSDGVDRVKVLDFGIAYLADASRDGDRLTRTGDFRGTAHYMAPEQWRGNAVGAKADIYAVGVMLFEALTGIRPFDGPDLPALIMQHVLVEAPLLSSVGSCRHSRELEALVARTLAKDPATRPTARELGQEVYRLLQPLQHESATMEVAPVSGKRPVAA